MAASTSKTKVVDSNTISVEIEFNNGDGKTVTKTINAKPLNVVPLGVIRKTRRDANEQMWAIFEWACDEDNLAILDEIPATMLETVLLKMQEASSITAGES